MPLRMVRSRRFVLSFVRGALLLAVPCIALHQASDGSLRAQGLNASQRVEDRQAGAGDQGTEAIDTGADDVETLSAAEQAAALAHRGRANVLGMDLEEGPNHRAVVVDVAAASPAFDAGVREGDVIVSFDGFTAKTYREWIDGIRRMVTDTPDGASVAVEVLRNGKQVVANVRTLESRANDPLLPNLLAPTQAQAGVPAAGAAPAQAAPPQPNGIPGNNVFINNAPLNEVFSADLGPAIERAVAELVLLGEHHQYRAGVGAADAGAAPALTEQPNASGAQTASQPATPPAGPEGRIGFAGFRDAQDGLLVLVDIGGLAPGRYRVSIEDPALVLGRERMVPSHPRGAPAPGAIETQSNQTRPGGSITTSSNGSTPPPDQVNPPATSTSGRVLPSAAPATGRVVPQGTSPVGSPANNSSVAGAGGSASSRSAATGKSQVGTLSQVGVITVDESGSGTLQQVIEGVRVRDIVGQAIVIHAPRKPSDIASPERTNTTDAIAGEAASSVGLAGETGQSGHSAWRPFAAGIIRLLSDHRPMAGIPQSEPQPGNGPQPGAQPEPNVSERTGPGQQPTR